MRSDSGQQKRACIEFVVAGKEVDGEEDDEEKPQCLFARQLSVEIFYAFLYYRELSSIDNIQEGSIMHFGHHNTLVTTLLIFLVLKDKHEGRRQTLYKDILTTVASDAVSQCAG